MATAIRIANREETNRKVAHPLARLRSYIRFYVLAEGLGVFFLYIALWFWIGLLLDYGMFKGFWLGSLADWLGFSVDWVQVLPWGVRAGISAVIAAGLVAVVVSKVLTRAFREFRLSALALVLERRFPQVLGERLISAVELADPRLTRDYGYSEIMIDQTIQEASERVDQVAVQEVFDWQRLRKLGFVLVLLTIGLFVAVAGVYAAANAGLGGFTTRFGDVAAIWFERNILLQDTIWPRRAYLELIDFPDDEIRIGRDAPPPTIRVRALKWVIADADRKQAPEGWRALTWADLTPELLGAPAPTSIPAEWTNWTMDRVELQLDKPEVVGNLPGTDTVPSLRRLFEQLHERAALSSMSRRLRELLIPTNVVAYFRGHTVRNEQTLAPGSDHEFSTTVANLKESVRFTVRGEDYDTPSKWIIVVPPPNVTELTVEESQPEYLFRYGPREELLGKKRAIPARPISLTGDKSLVQVPLGTDVVLTVKTDKPLDTAEKIRMIHAKGNSELALPVEIVDDHTFRVRFANVAVPYDFMFSFTDTDHVSGRRRVEVRPTLDTIPEVDAQVEVIRKVKDAYMVTPQAHIPFSGKVRDDRGLAALEYVYTVELADVGQDASHKLPLIAAAAGSATSGGWGAIAAQRLIGLIGKPLKNADSVPEIHKIALASFDKELRKYLDESKNVMLRDFELNPELDRTDAEYFDVLKLGLKVSDDKAIQPQYRMRLWLAATDTNIETGPGVGLSKEKFSFLIVSENDLLAEIAKEEEGLHTKLEEAVSRLKDSKIKLDKIAQDLPELKKEEFSPMVRRTEEIGETVNKGWDTSREVLADYNRIRKELEANRVTPGMIAKVKDKICAPLEIAVNNDFTNTDEALNALKKKLEQATNDPAALQLTKQRLQTLIDRLDEVLSAMGDVTTLNKLITALAEIEKRERKEYERLKALYREKEEAILGPLDTPKPKEKK